MCSGKHPANYKGCPVYKDAQNKQFPPLRRKTPEKTQEHTGDRNSSVPGKSSLITEGVSFAQATRNSYEGCDSRKQVKVTEQEAGLSVIIQDSFARFESMLSKQAEQINTLLKLLTTVISRLK